MASNKDHIKNLEAALGKLQDGIAEMKIGRSMFYLKLTKLELPTYRGDEDPTEWFIKVDQFFEYQGTPVTQKVSLASYHLQGESNQWWRWLCNAYQEEGKEVIWETFYEELWSRFDSSAGQTVRRTGRKTSLPYKYIYYVLNKDFKYSINKVVNYSNLSLDNFVFTTSINKIHEPTTYLEAVIDSRWIEAVNQEIEALNRNRTWEVTNLPSNRKPIGYKWVYKVKYKSNGEVERFKAMLVTIGYNQREGINYEETFTLVVKIVTVRKYCTELLFEFGMLACKPCNIPIETNLESKKLVSKFEDDEALIGITHYQKLVGKLIF
ncbi:ribonuclease H-like domain-containing protein [Tanacetum coccineum]